MLPVRSKGYLGIVVNIIRTYRMKKLPDLSNIVQKKPPNLAKKQLYDCFLVLDFEATSESRHVLMKYEREIIEFPVYKVNSSTFQIEDSFHSFVKPTLNPVLSNFSSKLTGISQANVNDKPVLKEVLENFNEWMNEKVIESSKSFIFVTSGDWDLMDMLPNECRTKNIQVPMCFYPYVNVNKSFAYTMGRWPRQGRGRLPAMLKLLDLEPMGEMHQGTSDCENIARVMKALAEKGHVFKPTSKTLPQVEREYFPVT